MDNREHPTPIPTGVLPRLVACPRPPQGARAVLAAFGVTMAALVGPCAPALAQALDPSGAGVLEIFTASVHDENTHQGDLSGQAFGVFLISAAVFSAIYDISDAPSAARRANARNGLASLGLAPVAIPGCGSPGSGLAMVGQF